MRYFEDLVLGETAPVGPIPFDREGIVTFASSYDPYPFHLDEAAAAASLLGGLAASGWQSTVRCLEHLSHGYLADVACAGSMGCDDLRWFRPVMVGDALSGTARLDALENLPARTDAGLARFAIELINQHGAPVLSVSFPILVRRSASCPPASRR